MRKYAEIDKLDLFIYVYNLFRANGPDDGQKDDAKYRGLFSRGLIARE